jgi:hypothetical protein
MVKTLSQKKYKMVNFKLTEEQYRALQEIADLQADGNMSSLLRRWIIGAKKMLTEKLTASPS